MSSNGSYDYDYDVDLDVLPVGEQYDYEEEEATRRRREEELERFRLCSNLALIEISSCFRNGPEPLFDLLNPILWENN